jgi:hypothetical protein
LTDFTAVAPNSPVGSNAPGLPPIDLATVPPRVPRTSLTVGPKFQLVPVDHDPFAAAGGAQGGPVLTPVDHDPFAEPSVMDTVKDVGKSAGIGLAKGAIGLAGLPGDAMVAADSGVDWLAEKFMSPENFQAYLKANAEGRKPLLPTSKDITEKARVSPASFMTRRRLPARLFKRPPNSSLVRWLAVSPG